MGRFTRYLTASSCGPGQYDIGITATTPSDFLAAAARAGCDVRYSPILPAYLTPGAEPPSYPEKLESIGFLFSPIPYTTLGKLKESLSQAERQRVYFTEGLASLIFVDFQLERVRQLNATAGTHPLEYWRLADGKFDLSDTLVESVAGDPPIEELQLPASDDPEITVYVEQIAASLTSLWSAYGRYLPEERATIRSLAQATSLLVEQQAEVINIGGEPLIAQKKSNAIVSALVELSAALSYSVTQGTSGVAPILANRSPFPHHSLLGVGGSVRALTRYTRYLENAFMARSAGEVITRQYFGDSKAQIPASIAKYSSGSQYRLTAAGMASDERFDRGGEFKQEAQIPLIVHFSLRHGFMESKYSVTAASESLTAETEPQWTLMTLSHEVMHSRVRTIFNALFPTKWEEDETEIIKPEYLSEFAAWRNEQNTPTDKLVAVGLRSAILNFCYSIEQFANPVAAAEDSIGRTVSLDKMRECYSRHKQLATEVVVHFHDYYFAYASQPKMYVMSVWASWIKVAAPYTRTIEYLARSLATIACGTGLPPREAYNHAADILVSGLDALEAYGIRSALFTELRRILASDSESEVSRALFKPLYYLIDQVRLFFASPLIASNIDSLREDPFADGSTATKDYTASIYVFGEGERVSPIRFSLAALFSTLSNNAPIDDRQWLTAWNYMVISSQE